MGWHLYSNFSEENVCISNNRFELTYASYLPIDILYCKYPYFIQHLVCTAYDMTIYCNVFLAFIEIWVENVHLIPNIFTEIRQFIS